METVKRLSKGRLRVTFDDRDEIWTYHPDASGGVPRARLWLRLLGDAEVYAYPGLPSRLPRLIRDELRHRLATNELGCSHRPAPLPDFAFIRFGGRSWAHGRADVKSDWQFAEGGWARFWRRPLQVSTLIAADRSLGWDRPPLLPKEKYSRLEKILPAA